MAAAAIPLALKALPWAITGLSGLAGLFGGRSKTQTMSRNESGTRSGTQTQNFNTQDMPVYTPEMQTILNAILAQYQNRIKTGTDLSGYQTSGLQNINQAADLKRRVMDNMMASRGLSSSPTAGSALGRIESGRIGEQVNFLNQIPLLQRQLQGEDINNYANFFKSLPVGTARTGSNTTTSNENYSNQMQGTSTDPGNMLAGLFGGVGSGLAATFGRKYGMFG